LSNSLKSKTNAENQELDCGWQQFMFMASYHCLLSNIMICLGLLKADVDVEHIKLSTFSDRLKICDVVW
jgi:hypothetical protein